MEAGKLRHKVDILSPTVSRSTASGEEILTWSTVLKSRWANVEPLSGMELYQSKRMDARIETRVITRYSSLINPECKLVYGGSTYEIFSVIDVGERRIETQILCAKEVT